MKSLNLGSTLARVKESGSSFLSGLSSKLSSGGAVEAGEPDCMQQDAGSKCFGKEVRTLSFFSIDS